MAASEDQSLGEMIALHLPYLRRYARALTGQQTSGDAYAGATLEALMEDLSIADRYPPRIALFHAFHSVWASSGRQIAADPTEKSPLEAKAQDRLGRLTVNTREAVLLHTVEDFSASEIATIMAVSEDEAHDLVVIGLKEMANQMAGRVMIIEDEPVIAMDLRSIVEDCGHTAVGVARTRDEAVAMARDTQPDLVLADVQLADGSSGIDAAHDILADRPSMPVIFITAYPERLLTGSRPEPAFLITKPFKEQQVRTAVSQSLFFASTAILA